MAERKPKTVHALSASLRRDLRAVTDRTANEAQFQRIVIRYAKDRGWMVNHTPPATIQGRNGRSITPTQGHAGLPDLIMVRDGRCVFAELKGKGGPTPLQQAWLARLERCEGVEAYLWWPRDWPTVRDVLR